MRATSVPDGIHAIAVGEFAGSGGTDIAVASEQTSAVVLLRNRDDRSGFDATATALPSRALSIGAVKFNLDNHADLVVGLENLSLIHISEPTRLLSISYAVFCLKKKKQQNHNNNTSALL